MLHFKEGSNLAVLKQVSKPSNVKQAPPDGLWNFNKVSIELSFVSVSGSGRSVGVNISVCPGVHRAALMEDSCEGHSAGRDGDTGRRFPKVKWPITNEWTRVCVGALVEGNKRRTQSCFHCRVSI